MELTSLVARPNPRRARRALITTGLRTLILALTLSATTSATAFAVNFATNQAPSVELGAPDFVTPTSGPRFDRSFGFSASGVNLDPTGRLLVADTYSGGRVAVFNAPSANGAPIDMVIGNSSVNNYVTGGCDAVSNAVADDVSSTGSRVAVADANVPRVLLYSTFPTANGAAASWVLGQPNMTTCPFSAPNPPTAASLNGPMGVWTDGTKIIVADTNNNRVLLWNSWPTANQAPAAIVLGQPNMTSNTANNGGVSASSLNGPVGVWSDGTKILVADSQNRRVLVWNAWPTANGQAATFVMGQPSFTSTTYGCTATNDGTTFHVTSDGTRIAVDARDQENDIWIWDIAREALTRLTFGPSQEVIPLWTPDSRRIVYSSSATGPFGLFWKQADNTGQAEPLTLSPAQVVPSSFSPDGKQLVFYAIGEYRLKVLNVEGDRKFRTLTGPAQFAERNPDISPDGRWIAYESDESGSAEIYVRPFPAVEQGRWQISADGGTRPRWAPNGRELFYQGRRQFMAVSVPPGTTLQFGKGNPLFDLVNDAQPSPNRHYDVTPDGTRFVVIKDPQTATSLQLVVIEHWLEELNARVPITK